MNVADYVVSFLAALGVRHVYGYPGSPLVPLMEALARQTDVEWVLMRHENSAALAASAHAKLTGYLGICVATSGPGALNFVCGVADAHLDRAPVLALTGLVSTSQLGHWEFQDIDQTSLFGSVLRRSATCVHPSQFAALLRNFVGHAQQHQEAVHLAVPVDVLAATITPGTDGFELRPDRLPAALRLITPPEEALDITAEELDRRDNIAIVVGHRALGAAREIEHLASRLTSPIITTLDAKGSVDESGPNALGVLGVFGHPAVETTKKVLAEADTILAFGVDIMKPFVTGSLDVQHRTLIQCEPDFASLTHEYHRTRTLVGPLDTIAAGLARRVRPRPPNPRIASLAAERAAFAGRLGSEVGQPGRVNPLPVIRRLTDYLDSRSIVVLDTGAHTLWAAHFLELTARQRVLVSSRLGVMGFSLPAAIAAQLARPDARVVSICGDGGFQMVAAELATAVEHRLPLVLIVFNNGLLQNVTAQQRDPLGTILQNPDFVALARAHGADGAVIDQTDEIRTVLDTAFADRDVPFLVDLRCDPAVMAPLSTWDTTLDVP